MIRIVDFSGLVPPGVLAAFGGLPGVLDAVLEDVLEASRAHWAKLAQQRLLTTRRPYLNGLQPVAMSPGRGVITLLGALPNALEQGQDAYDMHDTLLGPNVPVAGPGERGKHELADHPGHYYRAIPFRHAGPTAQGATGQPMGRPYRGVFRSAEPGRDAAKALGKLVYGAASKLSPTLGQPYGSTKWGGRLPSGMAPVLQPHARPSPIPGRGMMLPHSTDIYAGMVRQEKTYRKATQNQYTTFRIISDMVPEKWHRKATAGLHLVDAVAKFADVLLPKAFASFERAFK